MAIGPTLPGVAMPALDTLRRAAPAITAPSGPSGPSAPGGAAFVNALDQALKSVSASQHQAHATAEAFLTDPSSTSLEQAMVAMQKSQIGFSSALHVRNRLVAAYADIMNMQV